MKKTIEIAILKEAVRPFSVVECGAGTSGNGEGSISSPTFKFKPLRKFNSRFVEKERSFQCSCVWYEWTYSKCM